MSRLKLLFNNKGSSVIMVLIAMAFVAILGTILMFSAFTGYQIKAAQTGGERAFYTAETALAEIRAGIQGIVSDCIADAYMEMLLSYRPDYDDIEDLEIYFKKQFEEFFLSWRNSDNEPLVISRGDRYEYNGDLLEKFITGERITTVFPIVNETDYTTERLGHIRTGGGRFILEGIEINHRSANGFISNVQSDIVVIIPDFTYVMAAYAISDIPDFALIANEGLRLTSDATIIGSVYAGFDENALDEHYNSVLTGSQALNISDGTFISRGDIKVNGTFNMTDGNLWARRIVVGENKISGNISLNGNIFVADDLTLDGEGANAIISGRYTGFGHMLFRSDFPADTSPDISVASHSSSIIINGLRSTLNLSGLQNLFLAGHSFIEAPGSDILTGQSFSVQSDQLAYLIPHTDNYDFISNPIVFPMCTDPDCDCVIPTHGVTEQTELWNGETLADYNATYKVELRNIEQAGQTLMFLFIEFKDREGAIKYFTDYFTDPENRQRVTEYVVEYLPGLNNSINPTNVQSSGIHYIFNSVLDIDGGNDGLRSDSRHTANRFRNIVRSLSDSIQTTADNPYEHIVNTARVNALTNGTYEFKNGDDVVAVIIKCDGSATTYVDELPDTVNLIISTGNVNVNRGFAGLIISDGIISLNTIHPVTNAPDEVFEAMRARNNVELNNRILGDYLNLLIMDEEHDEWNLEWNLSALVHYTNWRRN
jgi:hypothetical protein